MDNPIQTARSNDGTATVTVFGEIDFTNADEVSRCIRQVVAEWAPTTVWIDLAGATFMDSTGLGALIEGYRSATEGESRLVVINPTASFRRVLTVTGLSELFGVDEPEPVTGTSFEATGT